MGCKERRREEKRRENTKDTTKDTTLRKDDALLSLSPSRGCKTK